MRGSEFAALKAFVEVAERRSFARAAEALRVAPSTLSQTIRELEDRLGVSLLTRTTRRVSLTGAGARLLGRFAPALRDMDAALLDARDEGARPRGVVRLHAPAPAYGSHIEPVLGSVQRTLPDLILDVTIDDGLAEIAADGFDLVIRRSDYVDSGMVAHDLGGDLRHAVVASPEYTVNPVARLAHGSHRAPLHSVAPSHHEQDRSLASRGERRARGDCRSWSPDRLALPSRGRSRPPGRRHRLCARILCDGVDYDGCADAAPDRIPPEIRGLEAMPSQPRAPFRRCTRDRRCADAIRLIPARHCRLAGATRPRADHHCAPP